MNTKKLLVPSFIAFSLVFLVGCGKSVSTTITTDQEGIVNETQKTNTDSKASLTTREQCIELMAYALKGGEYMGKQDMTNFYIWSEKLQKLEEKYNVNEKDYEEICNGLVVDMDFMNAVQKRVKEL